MTGDCSECVELKCALLATLIAKHGWGSPIGKDSLVNDAGISSHQQGDGKDAFDDLRRASFITNCGKRGIKINTSNQGNLRHILKMNVIGLKCRLTYDSNTTRDTKIRPNSSNALSV